MIQRWLRDLQNGTTIIFKPHGLMPGSGFTVTFQSLHGHNLKVFYLPPLKLAKVLLLDKRNANIPPDDAAIWGQLIGQILGLQGVRAPVVKK